LAGEQLAIVDRKLFDAVKAKLDKQLNNHNAARVKSEALLAGRIFDDRGNRMSPSHARKRGISIATICRRPLPRAVLSEPDQYVAYRQMK
jgi:hypothetical protein